MLSGGIMYHSRRVCQTRNYPESETLRRDRAGYAPRPLPSRSGCSKRVGSPPLVLTVAKLTYRRVIRKAGVERYRPFRVPSRVLATTSSVAARLGFAISACRATSLVRVRVTPLVQSLPKLSVVSLSRAAWVNGCCFRSIARSLERLLPVSVYHAHDFLKRRP